MRKISYFLILALTAAQASATYIVVLKNGTRYKAKDRWTMSSGKAIVRLENGNILQLDPKLIDVAKSEEATRLGYGDAKVLQTPESQGTRSSTSSLGELTRMRRQQQNQQPTLGQPLNQTRATTPSGTGQHYTGVGSLGSDVTSKFVSAFENVGFYDAKVSASGPFTLRIQLTADNEEQVFKAISATAYVMLRVPGLTSQRLDLVELFMATMNGGTAGRFQMTQDDAAALDTKRTTLESYFVRRVIF